MNKRDFRPAFTLAELIVVMLIIAVVAGVSIKISKTKLDNIIAYTYYTAYSTLRNVTRNMITDFSSDDETYTQTFNILDRWQAAYAASNCQYQETRSNGKKACYNYTTVSAGDISSFNCNSHIGEYEITAELCNAGNLVPYGRYMTQGNLDNGTGLNLNKVLEQSWFDTTKNYFYISDSSVPGSSVCSNYWAGSGAWTSLLACGDTSSLDASFDSLIVVKYELVEDDTPDPRTIPRKGANFCKQFVSYTNTKTGTDECTGDSIASTLTDFSSKKADIILRNGMRIYNASQNPSAIAVLADNTQGGTYEGCDNTNSFGYTLYVDIDGAKGNSTLWEDVFPFYVTMSGAVIPAYDTISGEGVGGNNRLYLQTSIENEVIEAGRRKIEWVKKSVSYKESACSSGYVGQETPYCKTGTAVTKSAECSSEDSNCTLKHIRPVKFFLNY